MQVRLVIPPTKGYLFLRFYLKIWNKYRPVDRLTCLFLYSLNMCLRYTTAEQTTFKIYQRINMQIKTSYYFLKKLLNATTKLAVSKIWKGIQMLSLYHWNTLQKRSEKIIVYQNWKVQDLFQQTRFLFEREGSGIPTHHRR